MFAFGILFIGCPNDTTDDGGGSPSTPSNPLKGTWVNDPDGIAQLVIFTDQGNNKGRVYFSTTIEKGTINTAQSSLPDIFDNRSQII
jgi:hypothetical protein